MSNFMKIRPVEAALFHADRLTKLALVSRSSANAPEHSYLSFVVLSHTKFHSDIVHIAGSNIINAFVLRCYRTRVVR
jgi:hypothetical protein